MNTSFGRSLKGEYSWVRTGAHQIKRDIGGISSPPKKFGHGLDPMNGPKGSDEFPVPATFVVSTDGAIRRSYGGAEHGYTDYPALGA